MKKFRSVFIVLMVIGVILSIIMFVNGWNKLGVITLIMCLGTAVNYSDIIDNNKDIIFKGKKNRRAEYFKNLNDDEKEDYYISVEKKLEKSLKK